MMKQFGLIAKFTSSKNDEKYFVPCQLKMPPNSLCSMVPSSSDPCPLYVYFSTGFVPHGLFTLLVSRLVSWCSEAGPTQPPTLYRNGAWFIIGRQIIHDLVLICKKQFIKFFVKQIAQDQHIKGDDTRETAIQVLEFLETTLQSLSKDLPYLRGLQYQIRVRCPYCQLEKCTGHNQMACTHEDCLHLLELRQGQPLICKRKPVSRVLTVQGQEKWFSQTISQVFSEQPRSQGSLLLALRSERERDPGKRWSRGSRTKLILREESFVSRFFCLVYSQRSRSDRNSKIDLLTLLQL